MLNIQRLINHSFVSFWIILMTSRWALAVLDPSSKPYLCRIWIWHFYGTCWNSNIRSSLLWPQVCSRWFNSLVQWGPLSGFLQWSQRPRQPVPLSSGKKQNLDFSISIHQQFAKIYETWGQTFFSAWARFGRNRLEHIFHNTIIKPTVWWLVRKANFLFI